MGVRVNWYYGGKDGALDYILGAPLKEFRIWYVYQNEHHDDEDDLEAKIEVEAPQLGLLDDIIKRGADAFAPESVEQACRIDLLVNHFYFWCGDEITRLLDGPPVGAIYVKKYRDAELAMQNKFGDKAGRLWRYLLNGRPVGRSEVTYPYFPAEKDFPDSYWTYDEVFFLYYQILLLSTMTTIESDSALVSVFKAVENAAQRKVGLIMQVN